MSVDVSVGGMFRRFRSGRFGNGAPLLPGRLRSADAIHLATALRLNARAMAVYGNELITAVRTAGMEPLSPGAAG